MLILAFFSLSETKEGLKSMPGKDDVVISKPKMWPHGSSGGGWRALHH